MRKRIRGAALVAATVVAGVMLVGCGHPRTEAQKAYLTEQYRSLGRCTVNPKGGDRGAPFDPMKVASWRSPIHDKETWVRVASWKTRLSPVKPSITGFLPDFESESGASVRGAESAFIRNVLFTAGVTMVIPSATTAGRPLV